MAHYGFSPLVNCSTGPHRVDTPIPGSLLVGSADPRLVSLAPKAYSREMSLLLTLIFTLMFSLELRAQTAAVLEVGLSEVGPLAYKEDGKIKGINYDILTQLEKESGLKFNYVLYPHARLIHSIENTKADLSIFFSVNCEKYASTYEIQTRLHKAHLGLYLKNGVTLKKPHLQIGLIRGTCSRLASQYLKPEMIFEVSSMDQAIDMLKAGHLDGVCGVKAVVDYSCNRNKKSKIQLTLAQTDSIPMEAVICRKKSLSADIKKKLDEAATKLKIPPLE